MHPFSLSDFLATEEGLALRRQCREAVLEKGQSLWPDDPADNIFLILTGRLRVHLATPERELSLIYLTNGDIYSTHTRAIITATQETRLLLAERRVIERELARHPILQAAVIGVLARTLAQTITIIEDLAFYQVRGRIARYLVRTARRQKVVVEAGATIRLDLGIEELAALLGTSRQTASTEFNKMIHAGVVARVGRHQLIVHQPDQLQIWADDSLSGI